MKKLLLFVCLLPGLFATNSFAQIISTVAGDSTAGYNGDGINATEAHLWYPQSVGFDGAGNLYIGDIGNYRIRRVSPDGIISTVGGNGTYGCIGDGGPATDAQLSAPYMAVDYEGYIYFSDPLYNRIRRIDPSGTVTTIAGTGVAGYSGDGGPAASAALNMPHGIAVYGDNIYIADFGNNRVRMIDAAGNIQTIAGGGTAGDIDSVAATASEIYGPDNIATDKWGNVYVTSGDYIRKIDDLGSIYTVHAKFYPGAGIMPKFKMPQMHGIATDQFGNIFVSNSYQHNIYRIEDTLASRVTAPSGGTYTGDGGPAKLGKMHSPAGLAMDGANNLFIADYFNNSIRKISATVSVNSAPQSGDALQIFPNPSTGSFVVAVPAGRARILIINMLGETVKSIDSHNEGPVHVSLQSPPGVYSVIARNEKQEWHCQLLIK